MASNMQRLGDTLASRMKKTAGASVPTTVELGTINSNLSLTTDSLRTPIPKGDYMVDLMLKSSTYYTSVAANHQHRLPDDFRLLKAGDRVLVAWCGNEAVVVAIVVSS